MGKGQSEEVRNKNQKFLTADKRRCPQISTNGFRVKNPFLNSTNLLPLSSA
jgi:hypothetical protein